MSNVTITDVAVLAGVSVSTASKALNGTDRVGPDTIERVKQAAKKLGYKPNRVAQMFVAGKKKVGILLPREPYIIYSLFVAGLQEALIDYDDFGISYEIVYYSREADVAEFPAGLRQLRDCAGLIFIPSYHIEDYVDKIAELSIPKVSLQLVVKDEICPSVTVNEVMIGRMACEFLSRVCKGSKMAIITGERNMIIHKLNIEGFHYESKRRGVNLVAIEDCYGDKENARRITRDLLSDFPDLSGIFVSSYVAPVVCGWLKENSLCKQVKVIGVDVYTETVKALTDGSLSAAIYQNQKLQAKQAVEVLMQQLRGGTVQSELKVKPELVLESNASYYL